MISEQPCDTQRVTIGIAVARQQVGCTHGVGRVFAASEQYCRCASQRGRRISLHRRIGLDNEHLAGRGAASFTISHRVSEFHRTRVARSEGDRISTVVVVGHAAIVGIQIGHAQGIPFEVAETDQQIAGTHNITSIYLTQRQVRCRCSCRCLVDVDADLFQMIEKLGFDLIRLPGPVIPRRLDSGQVRGILGHVFVQILDEV